MSNKAVIFDLDGTLYDNKFLALRIIAGDFRHLRHLAAERYCRKEMAGRYYGSSQSVYAALFEGMSKRLGCDAGKVEEWYSKTYMPLMVKKLSEKYKARDWVVPELCRLRSEGVGTVVFSDYDYVEEKLRGIGLDPDLFDVVTDAFSEGGLKPCGKAFENIAEKLAILPSEILVVGDREDTDGAGARAAGMCFKTITEYGRKVRK